MNRIRTLVATLVILLAPVQAAHAYLFSLDSLSVTRNSVEVFHDGFDDGNPPPDAPNFANGTAAAYAVAGAVGPETPNGRLLLDRADAIPETTANGLSDLFQGATLLTNIQAGTNAGLRAGTTFATTAIFDLFEPLRGQSYGVRFSDRAPGLGQVGSDLVEMQVIRTLDDLLRVRLIEANFVNGTVTVIAGALLDPNHDQIALTLSRPNLGSNRVFGSFAYGDNGLFGPSHGFSQGVEIFEGEDWTRVQLLARELTLPEPAPLALLLTGALGLGLARKAIRVR